MTNPPTRRRSNDRQTQQRDSAIVEQRAEFRSSPYPPPAELERYDALLPGFAARLLDETEKESAHRRALSLKLQRQDAREAFLGQLFGLIATLAAFGTVGWLAFLGHPAAAATVGGTTIVGLVSAFIAGRKLG